MTQSPWPPPPLWAPPPRTGPGPGLIVTCVLLGLVGLVLTRITVVAVLAPADSSGITATPGGRTVALDDLVVGDCFVDPHPDSTDWPDSVRVLPCRATHNAEVLGAFTLPFGPWPGQKQVDRSADRRCGALFTEYVGAPVDATPYDYDYVAPLPDNFNLGDRRVLCVAIAGDAGSLHRSLQDAAGHAVTS